MDFVQGMNDHRLEDFELERVNESIIFLRKKHYVQHVAWEDKVSYKPLEYLYPKGIKLVQSSTPPFARKKVKEIIEYLFRNPDTYSIKDLLLLVRDIKKQFEMADIEEISMTTSTNSYTKNVIDVEKELLVQSGTGAGVKAAALHNHLLHRHPELKDKYEQITNGNKIKYYACKHPLGEAFGYMRGSHPHEFAPEIDIDSQFEKTVLNQVNTFVKALKMPELNKRLRVVLPLF
jgi:DNA polymerase elongation subunit (family B)